MRTHGARTPLEAGVQSLWVPGSRRTRVFPFWGKACKRELEWRKVVGACPWRVWERAQGLGQCLQRDPLGEPGKNQLGPF